MVTPPVLTKDGASNVQMSPPLLLLGPQAEDASSPWRALAAKHVLFTAGGAGQGNHSGDPRGVTCDSQPGLSHQVPVQREEALLSPFNLPPKGRN